MAEYSSVQHDSTIEELLAMLLAERQNLSTDMDRLSRRLASGLRPAAHQKTLDRWRATFRRYRNVVTLEVELLTPFVTGVRRDGR